MKSVSDWKFSAPVDQVDLARIMSEAEDSCLGTAKGVIRVALGSTTIVLACHALTVGKGLPEPAGYLSNDSEIVKCGVGRFVPVKLQPSVPWFLVPQGAVAVYVCTTQNAADELCGKLLDRVEVKVEVF